MSPLTEQERILLAQRLMSLLDGWSLNPKEILVVLDLPLSVKPRHLSRYRRETPLPDEPQILRRADYLFRIAEALRTMYPHNPQMGRRWMKQANTRMGRRSPLQLILEGGETGLASVLGRLDCTFAWDSSGSTG